jgi:hypothetical protein
MQSLVNNHQSIDHTTSDRSKTFDLEGEIKEKKERRMSFKGILIF